MCEQRLTEVLHLSLGVCLQMTWFLGLVDRDSRLDLPQSLNMHHVVLFDKANSA